MWWDSNSRSPSLLSRKGTLYAHIVIILDTKKVLWTVRILSTSTQKILRYLPGKKNYYSTVKWLYTFDQQTYSLNPTNCSWKCSRIPCFWGKNQQNSQASPSSLLPHCSTLQEIRLQFLSQTCNSYSTRELTFYLPKTIQYSNGFDGTAR